MRERIPKMLSEFDLQRMTLSVLWILVCPLLFQVVAGGSIATFVVPSIDTNLSVDLLDDFECHLSFKSGRESLQQEISDDEKNQGLLLFQSLKEIECVSLEVHGFTYSLCPRRKLSQEFTGGSFSLGNYETVDGNVERYANGDMCGTIARSSLVTYYCGPVTKILSVSEPRTCVYEISMQSPILCESRLFPNASDVFARSQIVDNSEASNSGGPRSKRLAPDTAFSAEDVPGVGGISLGKDDSKRENVHWSGMDRNVDRPESWALEMFHTWPVDAAAAAAAAAAAPTAAAAGSKEGSEQLGRAKVHSQTRPYRTSVTCRMYKTDDLRKGIDVIQSLQTSMVEFQLAIVSRSKFLTSIVGAKHVSISNVVARAANRKSLIVNTIKENDNYESDLVTFSLSDAACNEFEDKEVGQKCLLGVKSNLHQLDSLEYVAITMNLDIS
jgi:Glucosidase II beta subunit-like protein